VPIISRTLGLNMLHNYAKKCFANQKGHEHDLLMICCVDKTLVGWHSERSTAIMRERCGGQGFLAANTFGEAIAGCHAALTAEGDNRVLMIKVVKDMLSVFKKNPEAYYNGQTLKLTKLE
jgi:acyl-CoA oxidase